VAAGLASSITGRRFACGRFPEIPAEIYAALSQLVVRVEVNAAGVHKRDWVRHSYDIGSQ